jgi:hypothetical protein
LNALAHDVDSLRAPLSQAPYPPRRRLSSPRATESEPSVAQRFLPPESPSSAGRGFVRRTSSGGQAYGPRTSFGGRGFRLRQALATLAATADHRSHERSECPAKVVSPGRRPWHFGAAQNQIPEMSAMKPRWSWRVRAGRTPAHGAARRRAASRSRAGRGRLGFRSCRPPGRGPWRGGAGRAGR